MSYDPSTTAILLVDPYNAAAERFWSKLYIQHSAHIPPGRDGLFNLVRSLPIRSATKIT